MLSRAVGFGVKKSFNHSSRSASTTVTSGNIAAYKKSLIFFGGLGSLACFDYFARDAESLGGALRFMRSFKIACQISIDYNIGLYNIDENSEQYFKVGNISIRRTISDFLSVVENKRNSPEVCKSLARRLSEKRWIIY